ncbi:MAG: hypothetical protein IQL11_15800 [Bacteroidales bacterium]|nr:hypothetical protein [Bacteroidales bacterium]
MKNAISSCLLTILIVTSSCESKYAEQEIIIPAFPTFNTDYPETAGQQLKNETYYGVLTPVEICVIFNRLGLPYDNATLNPLSNNDFYLSNSKTAINTGIYGVDFGYLKLFGFGQIVVDYMVTIREMSTKLGIPDDMLMDLIRRMHNDISDPDMLTSLMQEAYINIENHLRQNERESTAGLIVLGGWIEAMFIATQLVYDPVNPDPEVVQKIAEQKYTLTSLLSYLKNYYDDPVVVYYTKKLKFLKNYFDSFEIYFEKGDLEIDTTRQVLRSSGVRMTVTVDTLNEIRDYISKLRTEMVTP